MSTTTLDQPTAIKSSEQSLYARIGVLLGLKSAVHSEVDLMERLEKGLAVAAVQNLRKRVGLTDAETFGLIAPRRTSSRREASGQLLSREEANKGDRTPMQALVTELGALAVEELLVSIEHGMFA